MDETNDHTPQSDDPDGNTDDAAPLTYLAEDLFRGNTEIVIKYGDASYWLRMTRTGKLLLTK